jgi:hypothetical protein
VRLRLAAARRREEVLGSVRTDAEGPRARSYRTASWLSAHCTLLRVCVFILDNQ